MVDTSRDTLLGILQEWYHANCDGDWEHEYDIKISNIDNPGWTVSIPLTETSLEGRPFTRVAWERTRVDWMICRVEADIFLGDGGSRNLVDIIQVFADWVKDSQTSDVASKANP